MGALRQCPFGYMRDGGDAPRVVRGTDRHHRRRIDDGARVVLRSSSHARAALAAGRALLIYSVSPLSLVGRHDKTTSRCVWAVPVGSESVTLTLVRVVDGHARHARTGT